MGPVWSRNSGDDYQPLNDLISDGDVKAINYEEIRKATRKFHHSLKLSGRKFVYKGWMDEQRLTAAKPGCGIAVVFKEIYFNTSLQHEEWTEKVKKLGQLRHPNLVKLIGYSFDTNTRILVNEFVDRGSLDNHLFRRGDECLSWETRIKVAKGAARCLAYLHGLEVPVIHTCVDTGHILLDADFNPKLSDCGRVIDILTGRTGHCNVSFPSRTWASAPEVNNTGRFSTTRSDVYSFGVVLLELISGLHGVDLKRPKEMHFFFIGKR